MLILWLIQYPLPLENSTTCITILCNGLDASGQIFFRFSTKSRKFICHRLPSIFTHPAEFRANFLSQRPQGNHIKAGELLNLLVIWRMSCPPSAPCRNIWSSLSQYTPFNHIGRFKTWWRHIFEFVKFRYIFQANREKWLGQFCSL